MIESSLLTKIQLNFLFQCPVDDPASDFDLNSLVEGVVDDDSDTPTATEDNVDTSGSIKVGVIDR